jgi:hypothetical protein
MCLQVSEKLGSERDGEVGCEERTFPADFPRIDAELTSLRSCDLMKDLARKL